MLKRLIFLILSCALLSACAEMRTRQDDNPAYSAHHYTSHDLDVVWNASQTGRIFRLTGTVTNPRYESVYEYFELRVTLLDQNGKAIGHKTYAAGSPGVFVGSEPMTLDIPLQTNEQVSQIKFFYTYGIDEDRFFGHFKSAV